MKGIGKYIFSDGDFHEGEYKNDEKNGYGIMYYIGDDKKYEGEYKDDKKNGYGEISGIKDGKILEKGFFENNNLIKKI